MAKPDVRMNYESMEKMAKEFDTGASQLEETMNDMKKIAQMMEGGALIGDGGPGSHRVSAAPGYEYIDGKASRDGWGCTSCGCVYPRWCRRFSEEVHLIK